MDLKNPPEKCDNCNRVFGKDYGNIVNKKIVERADARSVCYDCNEREEELYWKFIKLMDLEDEFRIWKSAMTEDEDLLSRLKNYVEKLEDWKESSNVGRVSGTLVRNLVLQDLRGIIEDYDEVD